MSILNDCRDLVKESNRLLHQNLEESVNGRYFLLEKLLLKRYQDKLVVVSDEADRKKASNETFRNKSKLKAAGFVWNSGWNSWTIQQSQLQHAQQVLSGINQTPFEKFIDSIEQLSEFVMATDNLSRKEELSQQIEGFVGELSTAVDAVAASAIVKKFLEFNARFRGYSWHNTLLIYLQRPNATKVAGFRQWQEKFHRRVVQGAKGIAILAPITVKRKEEEPAGQPAIGGMAPDEKEVEGEKDRRYTRFMAVNVFDVADTEAMDEEGELPEEPAWHGSNEPNQKAEELYLCAVEMAENMGIKIGQEKARGKEQGFASGDHINISSDVDGVNKAATVIHEIAHELLHFKKSSPFYVGDENMRLGTDVKELQAESVSYVVIRYYGLPAAHQATYVALWHGNKESVIQNLSTIKKAADFIIGELDKIQETHHTEVVA